MNITRTLVPKTINRIRMEYCRLQQYNPKKHLAAYSSTRTEITASKSQVIMFDDKSLNGAELETTRRPVEFRPALKPRVPKPNTEDTGTYACKFIFRSPRSTHVSACPEGGKFMAMARISAIAKSDAAETGGHRSLFGFQPTTDGFRNGFFSAFTVRSRFDFHFLAPRLTYG